MIAGTEARPTPAAAAAPVTPAPPPVSPDGHFYWNGQFWTPLRSKMRRWTANRLFFNLILIGIIVGLYVGTHLTRYNGCAVPPAFWEWPHRCS